MRTSFGTFLIVAGLVAAAIALSGCAGTVAGPDKKVKLAVHGDQWDRVAYGYVTIETVPSDALVSLQTTNEIRAHASVGFDEAHDTRGVTVHPWATIGSSPIVNFKVPIAGKTRTAPGLGKSMDATFRLRRLSLKVEKAGYQPYYLDSVVVSADKNDRKLVVELLPAEAPVAQTPAAPTGDMITVEDPSKHDAR